MRPLGTIGTWRAAPRALAAFVALALSSGAAFAMCTGTAGVNIVASDGETCIVQGAYNSTTTIAGEATGAGKSGPSLLTNQSGGTTYPFSFSISGANIVGVQADNGGSISLNGGSATSTGVGSFVAGVYLGGTLDLTETTITGTVNGAGGLFINGAGGVVNATNVTVTTSGNFDPVSGNYADGAYNGPYPRQLHPAEQ